jgi:predicted hotdog family 3-hydroxylacyl-ACP dehydratase
MIKLSEIEALMVLVDRVKAFDALSAKASLKVDRTVKWLLKQHKKISDHQ